MPFFDSLVLYLSSVDPLFFVRWEPYKMFLY